jgi:hypothetical protein
MESYWITVAALLISCTTLILGGIALRQKASVDYVESLEERLRRSEEALERCRISEERLNTVCAQLERRNASLMTELLELQRKAR